MTNLRVATIRSHAATIVFEPLPQARRPNGVVQRPWRGSRERHLICVTLNHAAPRRPLLSRRDTLHHTIKLHDHEGDESTATPHLPNLLRRICVTCCDLACRRVREEARELRYPRGRTTSSTTCLTAPVPCETTLTLNLTLPFTLTPTPNPTLP